MEQITPLRKFYYWIGEKLGYLERNGVYEFKGQAPDGMVIHDRIGYEFQTTQHFVKEDK